MIKNAPVTNLDPQSRFQLSNDNISKHREMVDSREFERATDTALLQYQAELCSRETNPTVIGLKIAGALGYLRTVKLLSEKPVLTSLPKPNDNLTES
jgi:hypothetical protein